ncbi:MULTISPECIES: trypsin-like serine protease [Cryobacterium]|uniref:Trypsin-like serine protease n=1 Tax=Cryobacterium breve TaxID=1259258 RepID=A0ABY2J7Y4_9MICO|nr:MULTISPECIES: trypsin-like serine protease [Cryobacterium]TFC91256.1 trypsin-like serine protease [Cryobacterium sp. TmT3-12]TFD01050.1 trypsin-like serine protease [Cryobacterium breve]
MRHKTLTATVAALALVILAASPAYGITDGAPDGDDHPYVGLMVAQDAAGAPLTRCSGTLISPTVFLTAGHCTFGASHVEIWFQADLEPDPAAFGYPFTGQAGGSPYTHPQYDDTAFQLFDLGLVVLDDPVVLPIYGALPALDQLDAFSASGKKGATFSAVGYGLQTSFPIAAKWDNQALFTRMVSTPKLNQINTGFTGDGLLLLSNNANTGGISFGDSGGPNFIGSSNVIAGVTSFVLNITCAGTGGVYRVDRTDDLEWLANFVGNRAQVEK